MENMTGWKRETERNRCGSPAKDWDRNNGWRNEKRHKRGIQEDATVLRGNTNLWFDLKIGTPLVPHFSQKKILKASLWWSTKTKTARLAPLSTFQPLLSLTAQTNWQIKNNRKYPAKHFRCKPAFRFAPRKPEKKKKTSTPKFRSSCDALVWQNSHIADKHLT